MFFLISFFCKSEIYVQNTIYLTGLFISYQLTSYSPKKKKRVDSVPLHGFPFLINSPENSPYSKDISLSLSLSSPTLIARYVCTTPSVTRYRKLTARSHQRIFIFESIYGHEGEVFNEERMCVVCASRFVQWNWISPPSRR